MVFSNKTCPAQVTKVARDVDRLERCACVGLKSFNKAKCKVLHLGQGNPRYIQRLGGEVIGSGTEEKNLGMLVDDKLNMSQQ